MTIKYEIGEYVFAKSDKEEARIIRVFQNGDDPIYEIVFNGGWHKIVRADEIERPAKKSK